VVKVVEFGPYLFGVRVAKFVEDGQGGLPGVAGAVLVAGGLVGVAEAGEGDGFFAALAEVSIQVDGVLVAGDGFGVVAEVVVCVAEAVPREGLPGAVAELLKQR
jgi:hypothetical protein